MRVKLFTLRYSATLGGFDESPLHDFVRDKDLLQFREHFFSVSEVPHLACVLLWQDAVVGERDLAVARELRAAGAESEPSAARVRREAVVPGEAFRETPGAQAHPTRRRRPHERSDPVEGLNEPERLLFNTLREWRAAKAREEGVPPFLIFTNRHLLQIVGKRPQSANALGQLSGIGPGKVGRYGQEVLALLHGKPVAAETPA